MNTGKSLEERLIRYPKLHERVEALIEIVEGEEEGLIKADDAEERVDKEIKALAHQALQSWAQTQAERQEKAWSKRKGVTRKEKKLWWMTKFGRVEVEEEVFRLGRSGRPLRPFKISAAVECRGYSRPLQRVMVDFGAEKSFDKAAQRIKEHYGIDIAQSAVRRETLHHAAAIKEQQEVCDCQLLPGPGAEIVIGEMDGSMVPIVEFIAPKQADEARERRLKWEEARLALAREVSSITPYYGATMGGVEEAGEVLAACVRRAGAGNQTRLHCLGDGAKWIAQQVKDQFGEKANYLLDFYPVSEYLAAAAQKMGGENSRQWLGEQKERLLGNRVEEVLLDLRSKQEPAEVKEEEAPVRVCLRYLSNHRQYLDYEGARKLELPIGSGEVESGHRSVIQQRLKIAGAWWLRENAEKMIALRVARANND